MRLQFLFYLLFLSLTATAQVIIKFQSVGFAGTTTTIATAGSTKHSMAIGAIVSQGVGQSNQSGFFWGNPDYRPAAQATGVTFSSLAPNSLTLTWASGNGTRRIVVGKATSAVTATLSSGTFYTANASFGNAPSEIGASSGNFAVYEGTGTTVTVTNLSPSLVYHFKVFEYNGKYASNNANIEYQTGNVTGNPGNRTTLALAPVTTASAIGFSSVTKNQSTVSWANGNGTNRLVVVKQGSAVSAAPVNGQGYSFNSLFGSGADLGASNFVSFDAAGVTNQATITNLLPNTVYHYQIFEYKGAGADNNFLLAAAPTASKLTLTDEPLASAGSPISQNSFTANWQAVTGAGNYYIDVSPDAGFATFVPTYQNKVITGGALTASITSLSTDATYYYRVRAENATGSSANSNAISVLTVPATPAVLTTSPIATTSFTTNWSTSASATDYFVDVATDAAFTQLVSGFSNTQVTGSTTLDVTGLTAATSYYLRVRAKNNSGTSPSSSGYQQFTIPVAPVALDPSNEQNNSFKVKWTTVAGADEYEINVSDDVTTVAVAGYPKLVASTQVEEIVIGLTAGTKYKYYIRAKNAGGFSANSNSKLVFTLTGGGTVINATAVTINASQSSITSAAAQVTGGEVPLQIIFKHRAIAGSTFIAEPAVALPASNTTRTQVIDPSWMDELGIEYYFVLKDAASRSDSTNANSANQFAYKSFSAQEIPGFSSGYDGTASSYKMFSIPADLGNSNDVKAVLQAVFTKFEKYDKTKWRLFHWSGGEGAEAKYLEFDVFDKIEQGASYWFNAVESISGLQVTAGVIKANQKEPFKIQVKKGWNQIGNPYPFGVSWSAIKAVSANAVLALKSMYQFSNGSYTNSADALAAWGGAFIYSAADGDLVVPVLAKTAGRAGGSTFPSKPDEEIWRLPIVLQLEGMGHEGAVGMHPDASNGMDEYDEPEIPRFINYLEMKTNHSETSAGHFSEDIVASADHYTWTFTLASNLGNSKAELRWNSSAWSGASAVLLLLDISQEVLVDMKSNNHYEFPFTSGKQFKVIYSKNPQFKPGITALGHAYPNPFTNLVRVPILIEEENIRTRFEVFDLLGKRVKTIESSYDAPGLYQIEWNGTGSDGEEVSSGMLLYRISYSNGSNSATKRFIKSR